MDDEYFYQQQQDALAADTQRDLDAQAAQTQRYYEAQDTQAREAMESEQRLNDDIERDRVAQDTYIQEQNAADARRQEADNQLNEDYLQQTRQQIETSQKETENSNAFMDGLLGNSAAFTATTAEAQNRFEEGKTLHALFQTHDVNNPSSFANVSDAATQLSLGRAYLSGAGVPLDRNLGLGWLRKAAAQGYDPAKVELREAEARRGETKRKEPLLPAPDALALTLATAVTFGIWGLVALLVIGAMSLPPDAGQGPLVIVALIMGPGLGLFAGQALGHLIATLFTGRVTRTGPVWQMYRDNLITLPFCLLVAGGIGYLVHSLAEQQNSFIAAGISADAAASVPLLAGGGAAIIAIFISGIRKFKTARLTAPSVPFAGRPVVPSICSREAIGAIGVLSLTQLIYLAAGYLLFLAAPPAAGPWAYASSDVEVGFAKISSGNSPASANNGFAPTPLSAFSEENLVTYRDPRRRYIVELPSKWAVTREVELGGDKVIFRSDDASRVMTEVNIIDRRQQTFEVLHRSWAAPALPGSARRTIYQNVIDRSAGWFSVYGISGSTEYYAKGVRRGDKTLVFSMMYPEARPGAPTLSEIMKVSQLFPGSGQ
jgi:TPR repeat protein